MNALGIPIGMAFFVLRSQHAARRPACGDVLAFLAGQLHLVPWGPDGLSLDLMRRDPTADNGVVELLVTELISYSRMSGISRSSHQSPPPMTLPARAEATATPCCA